MKRGAAATAWEMVTRWYSMVTVIERRRSSDGGGCRLRGVAAAAAGRRRQRAANELAGVAVVWGHWLWRLDGARVPAVQGRSLRQSRYPHAIHKEKSRVLNRCLRPSCVRPRWRLASESRGCMCVVQVRSTVECRSVYSRTAVFEMIAYHLYHLHVGVSSSRRCVLHCSDSRASRPLCLLGPKLGARKRAARQADREHGHGARLLIANQPQGMQKRTHPTASRGETR